MDQALKLGENEYKLVETVGYPNGGKSLLYSDGEDAIILDDGICRREGNEPPFEYMQITDKQNACMKKYRRVYRFLTEDKDKIEDVVTGDREVFVRRPDDKKRGAPDRSEGSDSSPLEFHFEKKFADVYGPEALKFLHKEYKITDSNGNPFFLDYLVHTKDGSIAVEENGVTYHHPQLIGLRSSILHGAARKLKKKKLPWLLPIFSKFSKINHYFIYYRITIFYTFSSHYSTFFSNLYIYRTYLSKPLSFPCQHFAYRSEKKLSL